MVIKLSPRLLSVANMIKQGQSCADIGTDHAYLPVYLIAHDICPWVVAADKALGPFQSACRVVEQFYYHDRIKLRHGDGLAVLTPGEVDCVVIAGMGGQLICEILSDNPEVVRCTKRIVLQPQKNIEMVRSWLEQNNWRIINEDMVCDGKLFYTIIAAEQGTMQLTESERVFGPCLLSGRHIVLAKYLQERKDFLSEILTRLKQENSDARQRIAELESELILVDSVLYAPVKSEL